ncbi:MAG: ATP-dependent helicase [Solirubrobacterales bacterium]
MTVADDPQIQLGFADAAPTEPGAGQVERLLADLNGPQREAVRHVDGPLLILAGAGSGKTRVLTHRIAHLLATGAAQPADILAITFTNKAANEMRDRVGALVGRVSRMMWVSTFHSACARIMRREAERLGYTSSFTIYDADDSRRMVRRCSDELDVDPKRFPVRAVMGQISDAKNKLLDAQDYADRQGSFFEETIADVYRLYEKRLHQANALDFDDLLVRTVNVLELFSEVRERYQRAFRYILVDEYQDTNHAQYRLLQLLAGEQRNLAVVGDDDQSVYGFRGAEIRNILDFEEDFPDAEVVKLEQNYRSTQTILSAAHAVVARNSERKDKKLWSDLGEGDLVRVVEVTDEHEEARWVAGEIDRMVGEEGTSRNEVAVFYRTNSQSRVLEDVLVRNQVPYQVVGGTKFYDRAEIKDAIAYLNLLVNPADAVAFGRIVNTPRRGIGKTSLGRITSHANTIGELVWDVARRPEDVPGLGAAAIKAVGRFVETIEGLRARVEASPVAELLEATLSESGYLDALEAEARGDVTAESRVENLGELVGVAREFDAGAERDPQAALDPEAPPTAQFLQQIALVADVDQLEGDPEDTDDSLVTLMTLHNAKGLEYDVVFMIGCEEGIFPHMRSLDEGGVDEERRLCYVGITRSRRSLSMVHASQRALYGNLERNVPSRFLGELPESLTERISTVRRGGAGSWGSGSGWVGSSGPLSAGGGSLPGPQPVDDPVALRIGDDVVHTSFGDGVVIGTEPGGVAVVRFSSDGSERKLMAEYAPIEKR